MELTTPSPSVLPTPNSQLLATHGQLVVISPRKISFWLVLAVGCSDDHVPAATEELLSVDQFRVALAIHQAGTVLHDFESADGDVEETVQRFGFRVLHKGTTQTVSSECELEMDCIEILWGEKVELTSLHHQIAESQEPGLMQKIVSKDVQKMECVLEKQEI